MIKVILNLVLILFCGFVSSKNITRCEFVEELIKADIKDPKSIEDHTCAAFGSSSYRELSQRKGFYSTASIYTIVKKYWCGVNKEGGGCDILCSQLEDEDVQDDILCADKIMRQQGTDAFHRSEDCTNDAKDEIDACIKSSASISTLPPPTIRKVISLYERMMEMITKCRFVRELKKAGINDIETIQLHVCAAFKNENWKSTQSKNPETIGIYEIPKEKWCYSDQNLYEIQNQIACFSSIVRTSGNSVIPNDMNICTKLSQEEIDNC
jgi:hypothetical protein